MALKAWYPLNGNVYNQGTEGTLQLAQTTAPAWAVGKVTAQSMSTGGYKWSANQTAKVLNNEEFSYACWFYVDEASGTTASNYKIIFGNVGGTNNSNRKFTCGQYPTVNGFHVSSWDGSSLISCCRIDDALPSYKWTHICYSYRKGSIKIYINGVLRATTSLTMANSSYAAETQVLWNYNGRRIQDVRIYDHALSAKEVAELAKGLMLHYPLTAIADANANLLSWTSNYTRTSPYVHTSSAADGYQGMGAPSLVTVTPGKTYYVQVKCDHTPKASHGGTGAPCDQFTFWFYVRNVGTSKSVGGYDSAVCFTSTNIYRNDPVHNLYVWQWTAPSNAQDITLRTNSYSDGTTSVTLKFWDFKIEADKYTAYVPPSTASQYASLGIGTTVERDASGMGNDGTLYSSPTFAPASPRYATSIGFSSGKCIWPIPDPIRSSATEFTISVWFMTTASSTTQCIWNGRKTVGYACAIFILSTNMLRVDDSVQTSAGTITANTWYHLAVTWKSGGNKTIYLNGTQISSVSAGTLSKTNSYASIGRSSDNDTLSSGNYFSGQMSDFRIYATALTADQVKELYSAPVSIANNGTLVAGEFVESATAISVNKNGVLSASSFASIPAIFGKEIRIEPDGSAWLKIVHHADAESYKFASSDPFATGVYKDSRRWFMGHVCSSVDKWELMVELRANSTASTYKYRWVQQYDPNVATFANVAAANITKYTTSQGYNTINSSYGGIYKKNSSTYYSANDGNSGDWWGAIGSWASVTGGIPAYNGVVVGDGGYEDLWLRVDNVTWNTAVDRVSFDRGGAGIRAVDLLET